MSVNIGGLLPLIENHYNITIASYATAPRGYAAETFIITDNHNCQYFIKASRKPLFCQTIKQSLASLNAMHQSGIKPICYPLSSPQGFYFYFGEYLITAFNYINAPQNYEYSLNRFGEILGEIHLQTPEITTLPRKEDFLQSENLSFIRSLKKTIRHVYKDKHIASFYDILKHNEDELTKYMLSFINLRKHCYNNRDNYVYVITHGDAGGNTLVKSKDDLYLIDWDNIMLSPPERDTWTMAKFSDFINGYQKIFPNYKIDYSLQKFYTYEYFFNSLRYIYNDIYNPKLSPSEKTKSLAVCRETFSRNEWFYPYLQSALKQQENKEMTKINLPQEVKERLNASDDKGLAWFNSLPSLIEKLSQKWGFTPLNVLEGGTHALVMTVLMTDGKENVLKISAPAQADDGDLSFYSEVKTLQKAQGNGYAELRQSDLSNRAILIEKLGQPLQKANLPIEKQIKIICTTLAKSWAIPITKSDFPDTQQICDLFIKMITKMAKKYPAYLSESCIDTALSACHSRHKAYKNNPAKIVLVHGDPHNLNILKDTSSPNAYKFIDSDGIASEPEYDLGVLMREWPEVLSDKPIQSGKRRCNYLHFLTGLDQKAIWEWGMIQCTATALLCHQTSMEEKALELAKIAGEWSVFFRKENICN